MRSSDDTWTLGNRTRKTMGAGRRGQVAIAAAAVLLSSLLIAAPAAAEDGLEDLTSTSEGQDLIAQTEDRLGDAVEYRVVTGVPGDEDATWVLPEGEPVPTVVTEQDGKVSFAAESSPESDLGSTSFRVSALAAAPSLKWQTPVCAARYTKKVTGTTVSIGWMDRCTKWAQLINDGDSSRDHWVFNQYATCKGVGNWALTLCEIGSSKASGSPTLYWEDWAPRSDSSGSCRSVSVSVSAYGVGVSGSYTACETLDITKGSAAASFKSAWKGWVINSERDTEYQIAMGVAQGKLPRLATPFAVDAANR